MENNKERKPCRHLQHELHNIISFFFFCFCRRRGGLWSKNIDTRVCEPEFRALFKVIYRVKRRAASLGLALRESRTLCV